MCEAIALLGAAAPNIEWFGRDTPFGRREQSTSRHLAEVFPKVWGQRVFHLSPAPPSEIAKRQAAAQFNLVPSEWDVFNLTAAEAMASGRPTIVSKGAGASELIVEGENGFLFESASAESLAAAIERAMSIAFARQAQIGASARDTVRRELDPANIARARLAAYEAAATAHDLEAPAPIEVGLANFAALTDRAPTKTQTSASFPIAPWPDTWPHGWAGGLAAAFRGVEGARERFLALLIPAWNAAAWLPRLLASAAAQTEPFDEIWVYDDASSDDTAAIAERLGARVVRGDVNAGLQRRQECPGRPDRRRLGPLS